MKGECLVGGGGERERREGMLNLLNLAGCERLYKSRVGAGLRGRGRRGHLSTELARWTAGY
jgi:hypothetical protein